MAKADDREKRAKRELDILYGISHAVAHQHDIPALLDEVLAVLDA